MRTTPSRGDKKSWADKMFGPPASRVSCEISFMRCALFASAMRLMLLGVKVSSFPLDIKRIFEGEFEIKI
jgi:hypothetical protein